MAALGPPCLPIPPHPALTICRIRLSLLAAGQSWGGKTWG